MRVMQKSILPLAPPLNFYFWVKFVLIYLCNTQRWYETMRKVIFTLAFFLEPNDEVDLDVLPNPRTS